MWTEHREYEEYHKLQLSWALIKSSMKLYTDQQIYH